jgi:succinate-semialdehyde dehydrogenase/glutarate-semialdehyde dehydrogenase
MYEDLCLYIDGKFIKGDGRREQDVQDPATGDVLGKLPHATPADLDVALAALSGIRVLANGIADGEEPHPSQGRRDDTRPREDDLAATSHSIWASHWLRRLVVTRCADHCDWHAEECRRIMAA